MSIALALGISAAVLHGIAYYLYNRQAKLGQSLPNIASWGVRMFMATLNAFSYRAMSGDWVATLQFFTGSVACTITFFYVLAIGKFSWPKSKEWRSFGIGLVAVVVWQTVGNTAGATIANMLGLLAFVISFKPTLDGVRQDPNREKPLAWSMWTAAFTITVINVLVRHGISMSLVTPVVLLAAHGSITVLSRESRKEIFGARARA